jgi:CO/xanthine dehydrogenase FAD-binding subunit
MRSIAPDYDLVVAINLQSAIAHLGRDWRPIAGGTDLMVLFNAGKLPWNRLVSIREIPELQKISIHKNHVEIGAAVSYSQIRRHDQLQYHFPMLCAAASWTGGISNQNRGTLGGNIMNASPAADSPPALLIYDADLELVSSQGSRTIPYRDFHTGYKTTRILPGELLVRIHLPLRGPGWRDYNRKVGARRAQAISKVCLAASIKLEDSLVADIRIAAGSVAPCPVRCFATERLLQGQPLNAETIAAARATICSEILPISDIRSTADYRSSVTANLLEEFLGALQ